MFSFRLWRKPTDDQATAGLPSSLFDIDPGPDQPAEFAVAAPEPPLSQQVPLPELVPVPGPEAEPAPVSALRPGPAVSSSEYQIVDPGDLQAAGIAVETHPFLPPALIQNPPILFGSDESDDGGSGPASTPIGAQHRFVIPDADLHTRYGIVTVGGYVLRSSLYHAPLHLIPGAMRTGERTLRLPDAPCAGQFAEARDFCAGNLDNYFHWLFDVVSRMLPFAEPPSSVWLLPESLTAYQRSTLAMLTPGDRAAFAVHDLARLRCGKLHYVPDLTGSGFAPHPAITAVFDALRRQVIGGAEARPHRRIYISRVDSEQRRLLNEPEVIDLVRRHGFEVVSLSGKSVPEQIRIFAEASHIIAPHGAGLTNVIFCQPGTTLLELHMDRYKNWCFRQFGGLRGIRYGCLVGASTPPWQEWVHSNTWLMDLDRLRGTIRDPVFAT